MDYDFLIIPFIAPTFSLTFTIFIHFFSREKCIYVWKLSKENMSIKNKIAKMEISTYVIIFSN